MTRRCASALLVVMATAAGVGLLAAAAPARALNPIDPQCTITGAPLPECSSPGGGIVSDATGALTTVTLTAVGTWVADGARFVLDATSHVLSQTTGPQLGSTWFSGTYWKVAGVASVLTLPFLFAAAVQSLVRSDLGMLIRAAIGYLPIALLAVAIAAPLTMLLLAASDQMSAVVSSAASNQGGQFLARTVGLLGGLSAGAAAPFVVFLVGLLTVAGGLVLWMELLIRDAAIYVIVLMLPLAFAAFVWPARRIWAIRALELLVALILSKFVIVAVLSLGGAALSHSVNHSVTGVLAGGVLMALAALAPWAVLRLIPLAEVASSAAASLGVGSQAALHRLQQADAWASEGHHWITKMARMRDAARGAPDAMPPGAPAGDAPDATPADALPPWHGTTGSTGTTGTTGTTTPAEEDPPQRSDIAEPPPAAESPPRPPGATHSDAESREAAWGGYPTEAVLDITNPPTRAPQPLSAEAEPEKPQ